MIYTLRTALLLLFFYISTFEKTIQEARYYSQFCEQLAVSVD